MRAAFIIPVLLVVALVTGCSNLISPEPVDANVINPRPGGREVSITLYFPTTDGAWIETEERTVVQTGEPLEDVIIQQLLAGPNREDCGSFFAEELAIQVDVMEHIAYVSLPEQGMASIPHQHTRIQLQALVNSLTELDEIGSVQFLIDGKQQKSINVIFIGEPWEATSERVAREGYRPLRDVDPQAGEYFVEGEVLSIIVREKTLVIEQHFDSGSIEAGPEILLGDDVVIHLQDDEGDIRQELALEDIEEGDVVGIIMTSDHEARGIIVHRWNH